MNTTPYDLERVYDEQISPLVAKILEICKRNNLPMAALFQLQGDGDEEFLFTSSAVIPDEERPISKELNRIWPILRGIGGETKPLTLTTKNEDGRTTSVEVILP